MTTMICPRCWNHRSSFCDKCENKGKIPDVRLSKNFMLSELVVSDTAQARKIANDPTVKELDRIIATTKNFLQLVREGVGPLKVTSGFRSPQLNTAIKGSKTSAHLHGEAADVQPVQLSLLEMMTWLWNHQDELEFDQIILEYGKRLDTHNDDWIHLGYKHPSGQQRKQFLLKDPQGNWSAWRPAVRVRVSA